MTELETILEGLGLQQYYNAFVAEGFETWETVQDIQENDLEALQVKLGHRRILQRAIAQARGFSGERALVSPTQEFSGQAPHQSNEVHQSGVIATRESMSIAKEAKRKYRRHPKPDENAPGKPPSAYVLFSNKIREEVKSENLSFTDIARLVGDRWQRIDPAQKELYESHATALKEKYNQELAEYKKTDGYSRYQAYLVDFKSKHSGTTESKGDPKKPRVDTDQSPSPLSASQTDSCESGPSLPNHKRASSISSTSTVSHAPQFGGTPVSSLQLVTALPSMNYGDHRSPPRLPSSYGSRFEEGAEKHEIPDAQSNLHQPDPSRRTPDASSIGMGYLRQEHSGNQQSSWSIRVGSQGSLTYSPSTASTTGNDSIPSSSIAGTGFLGPEQRRDHSMEAARQYYTNSGTPTQTFQYPGTKPLGSVVGSLPPIDASNNPAQRILPPLPSFGNSIPERLGSFNVAPLNQIQLPPYESLPLHRVDDSPNIADGEAASTLAGLADKSPRYNASRSSKGRSGSSKDND